MLGADAPASALSEAITIGLPLAFSLITAFLGYHLGRRAKHDDIEIKRRHELASDLSVAFQEVVSLYEQLNRSYLANFKHLTFDQIEDSFGRHRTLHGDDLALMEQLSEKRDQLGQLIRSGRLYLNASMLDKMEEYLRTGDFSYSTDGGILVNSYVSDFFANLRDARLAERRHALTGDIIRGMKKLIR